MIIQLFNTLYNRFLLKPCQYVWYILFCPFVCFKISVLQYRVMKKLFNDSHNRSTDVYLTLLISSSVLNVPIVFQLLVIFPLFTIPYLYLIKGNYALIWMGTYFISLNYVPKMLGRLILAFTIYKKFRPNALDFIEKSGYIRKKYPRELFSDFFVILCAIQKLKSKNENKS